MRVKVCGITSLEDALVAVTAGAWALGFNFYCHSPRYITPAVAANIVACLPKTIKTVGIFINESVMNVNNILQVTAIQYAQVMGEDVAPAQLIKPMIRIIRPSAQCEINNLSSEVYAYLIDAPHAQLYGGSGALANWCLAKQVAAKFPTLLAGGLTPDNVANAILQVKPMAVDVCSGIEEFPGKKSKEKLLAFFSALSTL